MGDRRENMVSATSKTTTDVTTGRLPDRTNDSPLLLAASQITKEFPGCKALDRVSVSFSPGEIVAILGENGAGKSTLMKILAGVQPPDGGELLVDGQPVVFRDVRDAIEHGIVLIHQELNLAENLSIGANLFLGREPTRWGFIDQKTIRRLSRELLERVGLNYTPETIVGELSTGQQQLVEIAKALSIQARVLIMDEPTASLSQYETELLYGVVRKLKADGVCVIYISHRLSEIQELADRVVVLRDGQYVGEISRAEMTREKMVSMMIGRSLTSGIERHSHTPGPEVFRIKDLVTAAFPEARNSFSLKAGEIVGMAGLVGAGRTELLRAVFGIDRPLAGEIFCDSKLVRISSPRAAMNLGMALVPEDRKGEGLVLEMSVRHNHTLATLARQASLGVFINTAQEITDSQRMIAALRTKTASDQLAVQFLSGGNQQKVVIGKWLLSNPKILLLDEPTRGVDVGAKQEIYRIMEELAGQGLSLLFVSSDLEEVIRMSDRVLVMHEGKITGELSRQQLSETAIMALATGGALS
ncbi:Xylose import ATP-binding protein XylG [Planctopirus ephydatiae]|uniref:Xylose import ATP-binding protein XylG n=2 Tax=Planctopirus ephydatiae TaxID=2528019 RepID=A0A518GMQ6_9PLAN|nr:Xylose import ATP-binding protein XylG [Planctopirus ephydatiae]